MEEVKRDMNKPMKNSQAKSENKTDDELGRRGSEIKRLRRGKPDLNSRYSEWVRKLNLELYKKEAEQDLLINSRRWRITSLLNSVGKVLYSVKRIFCRLPVGGQNAPEAFVLAARPERIVIHHLGKAGEGFLSLPMATTLRKVYPEAHIEWIVLDRYRAFIGENIFVDSIKEVDSSAAKSLTDIGNILTQYHKETIPYRPVTKENSTWHCNAYCNYIVKTDTSRKQAVQEVPFYKQFFQNLPFHNHDWFPPSWTARRRDIDDGERFLESCGISTDEKVIVVSPFVADKTMPLSEAKNSEMDWDLITEKLKALNLPIIFTGTEFDEQFVPDGCVDGYAPRLSLGGLFYILQTRTHLMVCGNTGIGFAALFLKSNLLMYDNRKTWTEHTCNYGNKDLHSEGDLWPMFDLSKMKDDMVDWESKWIHRRFKREDLESDIACFNINVIPTLEVMSHNQYSEEVYSLAKRLLNVRGHKYQKLPQALSTCRISVLVSLYKAGDFISSRLPNLLEQTEQDLEVIVIDANSPENDGQIVWKDFGTDTRVTVIKLNQRVPLYTAWNIGLAFSRGKYITNANADDLLAPTALKTMADWLDENPRVDLAAGSWYEVKGEYNRWPVPQNVMISENRAPGHFPLWRRDLHCELGLFDDTYKVVGDIEWWERLLVNHKKIAKSMQPMGSYLEHGSNLFHTEKTRRLQEIEMSGWPYYHKVLYKETSYVTLPESQLLGTIANSPKEGDDLLPFRDKHLGERCFIMGNGPSLNKMDLSKLEGEIVFGCNACDLLFDRISWRPKYYSCVDSRVLPDISEEIIGMHEQNPDMVLFLPSKLHIHDGTGTVKDTKQYVPKKSNRFYFNHVRLYKDNLPWSAFSINIDHHVVMPHTVSITLLQLAFYMGFKEICLIGCDTSYTVPGTVTQDGPEYMSYGKLLLTSTEDDDPNHFDARYFGAGKKWHNPKVGEMIKHYGWAKRVINSCGGKVYNATVGGNLEVFHRVNFDDLFRTK